MKLGGLSKDAIAEMLLGLSQRQAPESLVNAVFEESQGNPFFVEELYRHLVEEGKVFDAAGQFLAEIKIDEIDVPENVRLILGRRLERFDASEKQALTAAAVIGRSFSFQLLTQISQIDIDELFSVVEKAQQMGIVVPSSEGPERPFTFAHELVRQTLLTGISTPRRQRLHADVGYAIEQLYPAAVNERAAEIAHHLVRAGSAGDRQKALRYLTLAGEDALRATAYDTALNHFTSALSKLDQNDSRHRAELLYSTAIAERGVGRWDDANRHWDEALDIFIALDDREAIGKVSFRIAQSLIWSARYKEAAQVAARGLAKLEGVTSPDRASLFAALGLSQGIEGDFVKAQEAFNSALAMAESLSDNSLKGSVLAHRLNFHVYYFKLREALQESRDIAELIGTERSPWAQVQRLFWTQCALFHLGRMTEAYKIREELEPLAKKIGHFAVLLHSARMARWTEFGKQPDLIQLKADLQRDLATNQAARPFAVALSHLQLSVAEYIRGDWEKARENADTAYQSESVSMWQAISVGALFRQMAYMGDRDGALALLGRHSDKLARAKEPNSLGSWALLLLAIEGLSILGEREQAAALYRSVCELIATEAVYIVFVTRFPQTIAGIAAAAGREWEAAEEHFQIAARQAEELPNWVELAEVRRFHGAMLLERNGPGDHAKGRDLLNAALQDYVRFGMTRHAEIAKSLLQ
jgi:tetratricopeptide (TPR) repeat protein